MDHEIQEWNHEKHETHERDSRRRVRTTNGHEWTRMGKEGFNHEKHETHEKDSRGRVRTTNEHEKYVDSVFFLNHE